MDHCERVPEETDSVVSERHFRPAGKNDSRKWILRDGFSRHSTKVSTVKDSYQCPRPDSPVIGRRSKIIREKLLKEAELEVLNELNQPPVIEEYITTHDSTYCPKIPGFVPKTETRKEPEMYDKYPLYSSQAMTYWHWKHENSFGNKTYSPGLTPSVDVTAPFKRNSRFSTPLSELSGQIDYL